MNVIGYIRVSTEEQAEKGKSLDVQRAKVAMYCELQEHVLVKVIEDDVSGKNLDRPGLKVALAMLDSGEAQGLVVTKLDRLTRSVGDWQRLIERYFSEKSGTHLFSVGDSIDTSTASGRLVVNMLLSVAQWERETIAERTRQALQHKIKNGERCGKVRYGYDLAADGVMLVENPVEQLGLYEMRIMRASGMAFRAIAREMEIHGFRTKEGKPWQSTSVKAILARAG